MNLLFDISILGQGHYNSRSRTGIFRVIENIVSGLANSPDVTLFLYSGRSLWNQLATLEYMETNINLRTKKLLFSQYASNIRSMLIRKNLWGSFEAGRVNRMQEEKKSVKSRIFKKGVKIFSSVWSLPFSININTEEQKIINKINIYHSPFLSIPQQIQNNQTITKFLTVYDLAPILFPHFFLKEQIKAVKSALSSVSASSYIFCISNSTKNDLCNYLPVDPSRVFVTPLAASPEHFYPNQDIDIFERVKRKYRLGESKYILGLNTLEPRKNTQALIKSFAKLVMAQKIDNLSLVLVGSRGWLYEDIFDTLSNYKEIADRIILTGYAEDGDLASLYSNAVMFVYPSFYEGFGLPPLEAMQCGVPVITSSTSSLPEVVGDAGIMIDPTNSETLAQKILELYTNASLREWMAQKSIERAAMFSWEKCITQIIDAYKISLNG
jgi:glycosyltransferase involved in cell wall biosynthesis